MVVCPCRVVAPHQRAPVLLLLLQAGAKHVYGIDMSAIAEQAKTIVADNGYADRVTIIRCKGALSALKWRIKAFPLKQLQSSVREGGGAARVEARLREHACGCCPSATALGLR